MKEKTNMKKFCWKKEKSTKVLRESALQLLKGLTEQNLKNYHAVDDISPTCEPYITDAAQKKNPKDVKIKVINTVCLELCMLKTNKKIFFRVLS